MKIFLTIIGVLVIIGDIGWFAAQEQEVNGEIGVVQNVNDAHNDRESDGQEESHTDQEVVVNTVEGGEEGVGIAVEGALPINDEKTLPAVCGDYEPVVENVSAPDFTLDNRAGDTITLSSYKGKKPVILDFWNTWCHNCQRDMPKLNTLYNRGSGVVEVLGINMLLNNDRESSVDRFVASNNITFPILYDRDGAAAGAYGVRFTSTKVLVNKDGTVFDVFADDIGEQELQCFAAFNAG